MAINKPHGLLVHKSKIAKDATQFALQELRNQLDRYVYPVHRLDRKTSGVLVFALNKEAQSVLSLCFKERKVNKKYVAIVRGFVKNEGEINYDLLSEKGISQSALTHFRPLRKYEIPIPLGKFETSRYTHVELVPTTGRMHQLRKHMAHIYHPIIGDRPHGCNKQNRLWKSMWSMDKMMLHASELTFPYENELISIKANLSCAFERSLEILESLNIS